MKNYPIYILLLLAAAITSCTQEKKTLPILGHREPVENIVNGVTRIDTIYQALPDFSLINQDSLTITNETFKDQIYVADFFFTSCPSICPKLTKQMLRIYDKYKENNEVALVSHTIDPKHDTIPVLKKYADKLGVDGKKWHFLRGEREEVYELASKGYMSFAALDSLAPGGITHSGYFILIDKERHIRGAYDGTDEKQVDQLLSDMDLLLNEYKEQ
jgi:protein SCO1/2